MIFRGAGYQLFVLDIVVSRSFISPSDSSLDPRPSNQWNRGDRLCSCIALTQAPGSETQIAPGRESDIEMVYVRYRGDINYETRGTGCRLQRKLKRASQSSGGIACSLVRIRLAWFCSSLSTFSPRHVFTLEDSGTLAGIFNMHAPASFDIWNCLKVTG